MVIYILYHSASNREDYIRQVLCQRPGVEGWAFLVDLRKSRPGVLLALVGESKKVLGLGLNMDREKGRTDIHHCVVGSCRRNGGEDSGWIWKHREDMINSLTALRCYTKCQVVFLYGQNGSVTGAGGRDYYTLF